MQKVTFLQSSKKNAIIGAFIPKHKYAVVLAILSVFLYLNTLNNGYAFDDVLFLKNIYVDKGVSSIPELLVTPYQYGYMRAVAGEPDLNDMYRPIPMVTYAIENQLSAGNPVLGHFTNIVLYSLCVVLVFNLLSKLFEAEDPLMAFTACLIFAFHPVHTEVVANIKSRDELLCFIFALLSLRAFLDYCDTARKKNLINGSVFFLLSLLSKETSITLLGLIPMMCIIYNNKFTKKLILIVISSALVLALYLTVRFSILVYCHAFNPNNIPFLQNQLVNAPSYASKIATATFVLGAYLRLLFVPYPLLSDYSFQAVPFQNFFDLKVVLSLLMYVGLIGLAIYRLLKKKSDLLTFGILFYIITISIFSNLFILVGAVMAERFLFFPSLGFCIAVAYLLDRYVLKSQLEQIGLTSKKYITVVGTIGIIYGGITFDRNKDWKDNATLFETDAEKSPDNCRLLEFAANQKIRNLDNAAPDRIQKRATYSQAIELLRHSLAIYPENFETLATLSDAFLVTNQPDSAIDYGLRAIALSPHNAKAIASLAGGYMESHRYGQAIPVLRKAIMVTPDRPTYPGDLGTCFMFLKQYDSAAYYFRTAWVLDPSITKTAMFLSVAFRMAGKPDSMLKYEAIVRQKDPRFRTENVPLPQ